MISKIYESNYYLDQTYGRLGRSRKEIELDEARFIVYNNKEIEHYKLLNLLLMEAGDLLNSWEIEFIKSISKQKTLTRKQVVILNNIKTKCGIDDKPSKKKKNSKSKSGRYYNTKYLITSELKIELIKLLHLHINNLKNEDKDFIVRVSTSSSITESERNYIKRLIPITNKFYKVLNFDSNKRHNLAKVGYNKTHL